MSLQPAGYIRMNTWRNIINNIAENISEASSRGNYSVSIYSNEIDKKMIYKLVSLGYEVKVDKDEVGYYEIRW